MATLFGLFSKKFDERVHSNIEPCGLDGRVLILAVPYCIPRRKRRNTQMIVHEKKLKQPTILKMFYCRRRSYYLSCFGPQQKFIAGIKIWDTRLLWRKMFFL